MENNTMGKSNRVRSQITDAYREGLDDNKLGPTKGLTEGLEPYEGKLSRTVLRGEELATI
jgi:hypothetical protein